MNYENANTLNQIIKLNPKCNELIIVIYKLVDFGDIQIRNPFKFVRLNQQQFAKSTCSSNFIETCKYDLNLCHASSEQQLSDGSLVVTSSANIFK
jgi:hypothetical protein